MFQAGAVKSIFSMDHMLRAWRSDRAWCAGCSGSIGARAVRQVDPFRGVNLCGSGRVCLRFGQGGFPQEIPWQLAPAGLIGADAPGCGVDQKKTVSRTLVVTSMPFGFSGADPSLNRRRRWLAQLPEETPPPPVSRARTNSVSPVDVSPEAVPAQPAVVSSLIPERPWKIWTLVAAGWLALAGCLGYGVYLDRQEGSPWREILGLQSGRLLHFLTTIALLICTQMSYLILWRRSQSRKDFAGRYQAWFWVGAVCSVFCVATGTRFHHRWGDALTNHRTFGWVDAGTVCWMMPATIMLISAMHLMRRDMRHCPLGARIVSWSRGLAVLAGMNVLLGNLFLPAEWVAPSQSALGAIWAMMFATALVWYARFVTHVTNEAAPRERAAPGRIRWQARVRTFIREFSALMRLEWQAFQDRREARRAAAALPAPPSAAVENDQPRREKQSRVTERTTAPLRAMMERQAARERSKEEDDAPATRAVNMRPVNRPATVHTHDPIPSPHFAMAEDSERDEEFDEDREDSPELQVEQSQMSPQGLSKKDRKRLQRAQRS